MSDAIRAAIIQAAQQAGIPPDVALAYAERESSFRPAARSSKTIRGLYQMSGALRTKYGIGDTDDPVEQTMGFGRYYPALKKEMAGVLGRDPDDDEAYLGHHYGGRRGAIALQVDPNTPVSDLFTRNERAQNPHFDKAGTIGQLNASLLSDIGRRRQKYGGMGGGEDFSDLAEAPEAPDFSDLAA